MSGTNCNCSYRCRCTVAALIAAAVIGVITTFLQITAVITVTPVFLWVALGVAVVYLGVLVFTAALAGRAQATTCMCSALNALLIGILGTILLAVILLLVGIVATGIVSAILIGLLAFFVTLMLGSTACLVRSLTDCGQ